MKEKETSVNPTMNSVGPESEQEVILFVELLILRMSACVIALSLLLKFSEQLQSGRTNVYSTVKTAEIVILKR